MDNIKDVIYRVIEQLSKKNVDPHAKIEKIFEDVLSPRELKHVRLGEIRNHELIIYVDSSAWLYEMNTKRSRILQRFKEEIPELKEIHFKIGKVT